MKGSGGPADNTLAYGEVAGDGDGDIYIGIPDGANTKTVRVGGKP